MRLRQGVPTLLPSNVSAPIAHISALPIQKGGPHLHTSAVNPPPLISVLLLQRDVLPLQTSAACASPPPPPCIYLSIQGRGGTPLPTSAVRAHASILLQGRGKPPLIPSTVRAHVPLLSALLLRNGVPLRQPSAEPAPLYQLPALSLQQGVPPIQPLDVRATPPPPLSVSLQGLGVPSLLYSDVRAYAPLLW